MDSKDSENLIEGSCGAMAYVLLNCEQGYETSIIDQLKTIKGITEVQSIVGTYDILAKIESTMLDILKDIINWKIRKIKKIRSTTTLICSESFFNESRQHLSLH
ncbi:MAG: Lrp/AsnC ligand binding domain-containing protein [Nitrosotalea sp.]